MYRMNHNKWTIIPQLIDIVALLRAKTSSSSSLYTSSFNTEDLEYLVDRMKLVLEEAKLMVTVLEKVEKELEWTRRQMHQFVAKDDLLQGELLSFG